MTVARHATLASQKHYEDFLLRYEYKQKDERETRERDGKLREELVKAEVRSERDESPLACLTHRAGV